MAPKEVVQVVVVVAVAAVEEKSIYGEWMPALEEEKALSEGQLLIATALLFSEEEEEEEREVEENQ
jgi:hypothetical protein